MHKPDNFNRALCSAVHTVVPGDTLYQIARQYGTDYQRLMMLNGIKNPYNIQPGQKICIPRIINNGGQMRPPKPLRPQMPQMPQEPQKPEQPSTPQEPEKPQNPETPQEPQSPETPQEPQSPETPPQIDEPASPEEPDIIVTPELFTESDSGNSAPRNSIYLSDSSADGIIYNITPGETLTSIQAKFGVCLDALKKENPDIDFSSSITGLTICIPYEDRYRKTCSRSFYAVKNGDTINTVADITGISADELLLLNPAYSPEDFSITGNLIRLI